MNFAPSLIQFYVMYPLPFEIRVTESTILSKRLVIARGSFSLGFPLRGTDRRGSIFHTAL
jgi:hypothetical protein